jgi:PAS domain S-box-containing protein
LDAIFGLKPGEFDGSEKALFDLIHPEDHELTRQAIARAIKIEGDYEVEFRILPRNRTNGWVLARGRACLDSSGEPTRLVGVAIDITALKRAQKEVLRLNSELEQRVGERTGQLEAINKELEAFSYSVSHDLRAPLRSVRGFCQVLLDRYSTKLDARGCEFLRRAAESSRRMDTLIEDLLQLSRISRAELRPRGVNLSALAESIVAELRQAEPQRHVNLAITPGLHALGEERLLRVVLENLLRNAWKFTAHQPEARIEFGHLSGPPSAFFVRDNGAGFDMKYADRLFGVFQRLHSATEFPGTGVGLATVQRILNRHGGRAWAEGIPQQGAIFYFTLPAHEGL